MIACNECCQGYTSDTDVTLDKLITHAKTLVFSFLGFCFENFHTDTHRVFVRNDQRSN